jgi:deoxyguanosine kinase
MCPKTYDIYFHIYQGYKQLFRKYDTEGVIYLRTSPEVCHERQERRKRTEEAGVTL